MATSTLNFKDLPVPEVKENDLIFISKWIGNRLSQVDLLNHVKTIHSEVLASEHVYRCICEMQYLSPRASDFAPVSYQKVIELSKTHGKDFRVIDIGCCFGQETRGLIMDGIPPECIVATDVHDYYWKMGNKLFMDDSIISNNQNSLSAAAVQTIFGDFTTPLTGNEATDISGHMEGKFHAILCFAIFHVLSKEQSERMITRLFHILKSDGMIFGYAAGSMNAPREWGRTPNNTATRWLYSCESLEEMFKSKGFRNISVQRRERDVKIIPSEIESDIGLIEFTAYK